VVILRAYVLMITDCSLIYDAVICVDDLGIDYFLQFLVSFSKSGFRILFEESFFYGFGS
jgi:hypothetical protein